MKKIFAIIFFLTGFFLLISCNWKQSSDDIRKSEKVVDYSIIPTDSNILYFPSVKLASDSADPLNKFNNEWYSKMLFALHEPVIFNLNDSSEVFRFTWLRTFNNPISVRINNYNQKLVLTLKISDGSGGFEHGKLIKDTSFYISKKEWEIFESKITKLNFWKLNQTEAVEGKDGSEWILEGKKSDLYHFVDRWSPNDNRNQDFKDCCDYLIYLSNIQLTVKEKY